VSSDPRVGLLKLREQPLRCLYHPRLGWVEHQHAPACSGLQPEALDDVALGEGDGQDRGQQGARGGRGHEVSLHTRLVHELGRQHGDERRVVAGQDQRNESRRNTRAAAPDWDRTAAISRPPRSRTALGAPPSGSAHAGPRLDLGAAGPRAGS
jgi:hypothetical protein